MTGFLLKNSKQLGEKHYITNDKGTKEKRNDFDLSLKKLSFKITEGGRR